MNAPITWHAFSASVALAGMLCLGAAPVFAADDALSEAKSLYANAAYEAALQGLQRVDHSVPVAEVLEYEVLCLLALGRTAEAERATADLVTNSPMFLPSAEEFPPRFIALVKDTRRKLLPQIAKRLFAAGREKFHGSATTEAVAQFEQVLLLTNDPLVRDAADAKDLQTLATGYLDLLRARPEPTSPAEATAAARTNTRPARPAVVAAVPLKQSLPTWVPPFSTTNAGPDLHGEVKVVIGADGRVKTVRIVKPTHPKYDMMVLQAAREWTYQPATLDGQPVESERVLEIVLNMR